MMNRSNNLLLTLPLILGACGGKAGVSASVTKAELSAAHLDGDYKVVGISCDGVTKPLRPEMAIGDYSVSGETLSVISPNDMSMGDTVLKCETTSVMKLSELNVAAKSFVMTPSDSAYSCRDKNGKPVTLESQGISVAPMSDAEKTPSSIKYEVRANQLLMSSQILKNEGTDDCQTGHVATIILERK